MSDKGEKTCPLCAEEMDFTDQQLKPCKCGYEICVWCWHHIMDMAEKDETEGRCPACRTPYDKEKIVGMAANSERLASEINLERKSKSQKPKPKTSEGRKNLSSVRVIQRNLVYIIGIPSNLADEDLLQRKEYFGQYGKVLKVSISRTAGGVIQHSANNTCSVYITYSKEEEAVRCIQSVHGFVLEDRSLRACFGTTKYCHAWLRNMPCSNPDCLYLHDIGTQEDCFTKDEIISAYTRSRIQQITGAAYNLQRRSGNVLPPPADDYCNSSTASAKPIVRGAPSNPVNQVKGSPPNGSSGRSITLPTAASWGMRASNYRPATASSVPSNGDMKERPDAFNGSLLLPLEVTSTTQTPTLQTDVGKKVMGMEESHPTHPNGGLGSLDSSKQYIARDCRRPVPDTLAEGVQEAAPDTLTYSSVLSPPASKDNDRGTTMAPNIMNSADLNRQACNSTPAKDGNVATNGNIQSLCLGLSSMGIDSKSGFEHSNSRFSGSVSDHLEFRSLGNQGLQQQCSDQFIEPLTSQTSWNEATSFDGLCASGELSDCRSDSQARALQDASGQEEDLLALDNRRLKVSEPISHPLCLPSSHHPSKIPNNYRVHSRQHSDACSTSDLGNADSRIVHTEVDEVSIPFNSGDTVLSNGYNVNDIGSSTEVNGIFEHSDMFSNVGRGECLGRFDDVANVGIMEPLDMGENSIISNILSMDFDAWDDSLTSPHGLAKLLNETDKQQGSLRMSSSRKAQNNSQSRFSFARQEDFANEGAVLEPSLENRDHYLDKVRKGFSSSILEKSDTYVSSTISSDKLSVSKAQISAPPGFTIPSRLPPPGFSFKERINQPFEATSGNHLLESSMLRNQYQAPSTGNIGSIGDVEFIDPAILAVGKGSLPNGMNSSGLDSRLSFTPQLSPENDARLKLLMQQSITAPQNMRFSDNFWDRSSLSDAYHIPSRLLDQSQASNLSAFAQFSQQQSRNAYIPNGHWDVWNEVQTGSHAGMAELLRNERLGFSSFFPGYEDLKHRSPSSGDLYRAFGM